MGKWKKELHVAFLNLSKNQLVQKVKKNFRFLSPKIKENFTASQGGGGKKKMTFIRSPEVEIFQKFLFLLI